jgi:hypothetical protein
VERENLHAKQLEYENNEHEIKHFATIVGCYAKWRLSKSRVLTQDSNTSPFLRYLGVPCVIVSLDIIA